MVRIFRLFKKLFRRAFGYKPTPLGDGFAGVQLVLRRETYDAIIGLQVQSRLSSPSEVVERAVWLLDTSTQLQGSGEDRIVIRNPLGRGTPSVHIPQDD